MGHSVPTIIAIGYLVLIWQVNERFFIKTVMALFHHMVLTPLDSLLVSMIAFHFLLSEAGYHSDIMHNCCDAILNTTCTRMFLFLLIILLYKN